jgi:hypothetical protein
MGQFDIFFTSKSTGKNKDNKEEDGFSFQQACRNVSYGYIYRKGNGWNEF